jgi:hypothetical protein
MNAPLKRRSRRDTRPIGNPPVIGPRDVAFFLLLTRYRYLDSRLLWRLLPMRRETPNPNAKYSSAEIAFKQRLQKLTSWGYVTRSLTSRLPPTMRYLGHEVYELGSEAEKHLAYNGIQEENITGLSVGSALQFPHALMICSTLAELEIGAREHGIRFITWPEILASAPQETSLAKNPWQFPEVEISYQYPNGLERQRVRARPDSPPFGFEYPDGTCVFGALEAERSNKIWANNLKDASWLRKALTYRALRQNGRLLTHFNLPNFYIFTVAPTATHIANMKELVIKLTNNSGSDMFCFSPIPVYERKYATLPPMPMLFATPFTRAGRSAFLLSAPT